MMGNHPNKTFEVYNTDARYRGGESISQFARMGDI